MKILDFIAYLVLDKNIFKLPTLFLLLLNHFPCIMYIGDLNKLEVLFSKAALCQVWINMTQWFWRRK